jgi:hypothetical protein
MKRGASPNENQKSKQSRHVLYTLLWVRAAIDKFLNEKPKVVDLKSWVKVYELKEKDEYDVENGWTVECGICSVEKYFFIKGMVSQQLICQKGCQGKI